MKEILSLISIILLYSLTLRLGFFALVQQWLARKIIN